jgi:Glyoxalase/Bleomycin resistance protein/Dioxygenase superfamily
VHSKTGVKTGQESRSTGHPAVLTMTTMDLSIHTTPLPHSDPEASLAFYCDVLGFEVRKDVGSGEMRWHFR